MGHSVTSTSQSHRSLSSPHKPVPFWSLLCQGDAIVIVPVSWFQKPGNWRWFLVLLEHLHQNHLQVVTVFPPKYLNIFFQFCNTTHWVQAHGHLGRTGPVSWLLAPSCPTPPLLPAVPGGIWSSVIPLTLNPMVGPHCLQKRIQPPDSMFTCLTIMPPYRGRH